MGYFTWTLANKAPEKNKTGWDYKTSCKLRYGAIVCPDNTLIPEPCYEGYGMFGDHDVYDLVVDWNKDHLTDIPQMPGFKPWGRTEAYHAIMLAYQNDDQAALQAAIDSAANDDPSMRTGENNALIPYPIKIVNCKRPRPYDQLRPSISTQ